MTLALQLFAVSYLVIAGVATYRNRGGGGLAKAAGGMMVAYGLIALYGIIRG